MDLTRIQFLRMVAGAGAGALALSQLPGCGEVNDEPRDAPTGTSDAPKDGPAADGPAPDTMATNCQANGTTTMIGTNHGHTFGATMMITAADVAAGTEKTYPIQGSSGHPHTVLVTAAHFTMLQQNMQVIVTSSEDAAHTHIVTIRCA